MTVGLGTAVTRRVLLVLALLTPFIVGGVESKLWFDQRDKALAEAREDARSIEREAEESHKAGGSQNPANVYFNQSTEVVANEAAENRVRPYCDWQRDHRLVLAFDAAGAPVMKPSEHGTVVYPGSSIPGVTQKALRFRGEPGERWRDATFDVQAKDASCLVDGTAVGVLVRFDGGSFAAMRLVAFDWAGYGSLLTYAGGALLIFWGLAELVAWQFNLAVHRRIGRITSVLQTIEKQDFAIRVPVDGGAEFALLGREINAMIVRVGMAHRYFADLNGFVAHNLRSPLTVARTLVASLIHTSRGDASALLSELDRQLIELDRRCVNLLERAKLGIVASNNSGPIDLATVVDRQVKDIFEYLAQDRDMRIELRLSSSRIAMPSDVQELIIDNLLQNALKFGEPGTAVCVELETAGAEARLQVANRGPFVSPSRFEEIFERGVTTGGYGMGLYAVRTAAEIYGGAAVALPETGGFRILVTLPLA